MCYLLFYFLQAFEQCYLEIIHQDSNHQAEEGDSEVLSRGTPEERHDQGEGLAWGPSSWERLGVRLSSRAGSSLEEDEVLDDDVNHENGDDIPGACGRGREECQSSSSLPPLLHPYQQASDALDHRWGS